MTKLIRTAVLAVAVAAPGLAESHQCMTSEFAGRYAFQSTGYDVRASPPSPQAISGIIEPDGVGGFTAWNQTVAFLGPPDSQKTVIHSDLVKDAEAADSKLVYEVMPNCQIKIAGTIQTPFGPAPLELIGGLADGGRKAMLQLGAPFAIGSFTAERAAPPDRLLEIENLVKRMAAAMGIISWKDTRD